MTSLLPQCALLLQRCNITARGGCPICKRIANLIPLHARACRNEACVVPQCREIKEHLRQNAMCGIRLTRDQMRDSVARMDPGV